MTTMSIFIRKIIMKKKGLGYFYTQTFLFFKYALANITAFAYHQFITFASPSRIVPLEYSVDVPSGCVTAAFPLPIMISNV